VTSVRATQTRRCPSCQRDRHVSNILVRPGSQSVRVVYAGSTAAYGDAAVLPNHELLLPRPLSHHAAAKLAGEAYCQAFFRTHGLERSVLRYFNVFGPRQNLESQYRRRRPAVHRRGAPGRAPVIFGRRQTRDFTFVRMSWTRICSRLTRPRSRSPRSLQHRVRPATSIRDLWRRIADIVGIDLEAATRRPRAGDVAPLAHIDCQSARALGYIPKMNLDEGLSRTIEHFRKRLQTPAPRVCASRSRRTITAPQRSSQAAYDRLRHGAHRPKCARRAPRTRGGDTTRAFETHPLTEMEVESSRPYDARRGAGMPAWRRHHGTRCVRSESSPSRCGPRQSTKGARVIMWRRWTIARVPVLVGAPLLTTHCTDAAGTRSGAPPHSPR